MPMKRFGLIAIFDPFRGVLLVLTALAMLGATAAAVGGIKIFNPLLLDTALLLAMAASILLGVVAAQAVRSRPSHLPESETPAAVASAPTIRRIGFIQSLWHLASRIGRWRRAGSVLSTLQYATAAGGALGVLLMAIAPVTSVRPSGMVSGIAAILCLAGAGTAATAATYLSKLSVSQLPESIYLARGARLTVWILILTAVAMVLAWAGQEMMIRTLHLMVLGVIAFLSYSLFVARLHPSEPVPSFPLNLSVLALLGSRLNPVASILDTAERQLGIDLRSTWALTVIRRALEPLIITLIFVGWLSTSLTVIQLGEEGLVERLGVPLSGTPLRPGLHVHWPWPVDRVFRLSVQLVQTITVGHERKKREDGPEDVLWARKHVANEYTLLLGNGRDLITIDAALQFRIRDARVWFYSNQNPADTLSAIAYRAVTRNTLSRTLNNTLSQNVISLTGRMRAMVQREADELGLGIEVVAFTVGALHPPVPVAPDYQSVVSAELDKTTAKVNAESFRNQTVPAAEAEVVERLNGARADSATTLGTAAGEAWSFRTLESQFLAEPQEYFFRRRLETLESGLEGKSFIIIDSRIQRDGGELWLKP